MALEALSVARSDKIKQLQQSGVASQRVADLIAERILSGRLKPGARLKQDELAAELNVSRIPIRDALRILETRGLVSLRPNAGARVTSLTLRDMEISFRIREQLEPMLLAESIPHLSNEAIEEMGAIKARLDTADDVEEYMPLSRRFHWTSFSGHRAPLLANMVERLWDTTQSYRSAYVKLALARREAIETMNAERELLFAAIVRRDADLAPRLLQLHIRRILLALQENEAIARALHE